MEEEIKQWSTGKAKGLKELITATNERDACQIETCDLGKTIRNQKQAIAHSLKDNKKCASDVQSEADTMQGGNTRLLDQVNMMQKENSDITGEISNMVAIHTRADE